MKNETLTKIFKFLKNEEDKTAPFKWKVLNNVPLTKEDLIIKDSLYLNGLEIESLPEGLKVHGVLNLSSTRKLKSLPSDLYVGGDLYLYKSGIPSLPEGLKVVWQLDLAHTVIESLPESLEVGTTLKLHHSRIKSLPEGLELGGDLILNNSSIKSLPKGLKVWGSLYIKHTVLANYTDDKLREMVNPGFIKGIDRISEFI